LNGHSTQVSFTTIKRLKKLVIYFPVLSQYWAHNLGKIGTKTAKNHIVRNLSLPPRIALHLFNRAIIGTGKKEKQ